MKIMLTELSVKGKDRDDWDAQLQVLRENVEHHIEEEEDAMFPKAEKILGERMEEVGDNMEAKKQEYLDKPVKW